MLTIDIDPQGNTTSGLGVDKNKVENSVYDMLLEECGIEACIVETEIEHQFLIPSNVNLAGAEIELIGIEEKEYILRRYSACTNTVRILCIGGAEPIDTYD